MSGVETRHISRDSLFLLAEIRREGADSARRVRVRNLSASGMMAEGDLSVVRGARLQVELRNVGTVSGTVAWVQDNRFGIAFSEDIDPKRARAPVADEQRRDHVTPPYLRNSAGRPDPQNLRKL
jgi:hypothetical protein